MTKPSLGWVEGQDTSQSDVIVMLKPLFQWKHGTNPTPTITGDYRDHFSFSLHRGQPKQRQRKVVHIMREHSSEFTMFAFYWCQPFSLLLFWKHMWESSQKMTVHKNLLNAIIFRKKYKTHSTKSSWDLLWSSHLFLMSHSSDIIKKCLQHFLAASLCTAFQEQCVIKCHFSEFLWTFLQ